MLFSVCLSTEARGLVRALLQPDPTTRLTAEQTLQHPWVKAMASMCSQRALTDKTQASTAGEVERQAETQAAGSAENEIPGPTRGEITRNDKQTTKATRRGHDEDTLPQQVHAVSPPITEHASSGATSGPRQPQRNSPDSGSSSRQEIEQHA